MGDAFAHPISRELRDLAMAYPGTVEGASCVNRAFKAGGKKNFLFLGEKGDDCKLMLKLGESARSIEALTADWAGRFPVGKGGWLNALYPADEPPPLDVVKAWIDESFRLLAPKKLVASLDAEPE